MYDPKHERDDHRNCAEHAWPNVGNESLRSAGKVRTIQCNNCLALKVAWEADAQVGTGEWVKIKNERIVEPEWPEPELHMR